MKIREGMSAYEAEIIMSPYIQNKAYTFAREDAINGSGLYFSSKDGDQCNMKIEDGVVMRFTPRFET